MRWLGIFICAFLLLNGCDKKRPGVEGSEGQPKKDLGAEKVEQNKPTKEKLVIENTSSSEDSEPPVVHPDFDLREVPVEQKELDVPDHISEVNSDIQKILGEPGNPALNVWGKYYPLAMDEVGSSEEIKSDNIWERLLQKIGAKEIPNAFYDDRDNEDLDLQKALYGLYLASYLSSSEGGSELFSFIKSRAADKTVRELDIDLYRIVVSGMAHAGNRLDGMNFDQWQKLSEAANPVYKMLAIQVGYRLLDKDVSAEDSAGLNQRRLRYYESFLGDESKMLRMEALKSVRNLGNEFTSQVLDAYQEGPYGEADQLEVDKIFGK